MTVEDSNALLGFLVAWCLAVSLGKGYGVLWKKYLMPLFAITFVEPIVYRAVL